MARRQQTQLQKLMRSLERKSSKITLNSSKRTATQFTETVALKLTDKLTFGKYKNKTIRKILADDPMYLCWLRDNNRTIVYTSAIMKELQPYCGGGIATTEADYDDELQSELDMLYSPDYF